MLLCITFMAIGIVVLVPATASAYVDPGSGGLVIQVVIGAIVGVGVTCKLYWSRIRSFFSRQKDD